MDWVQPYLLLLILPIAVLLWVFDYTSMRPLSPARKKTLLVTRGLLVLIALLSLAAPAWNRTTRDQAVIFLVDHSQSQGKQGLQQSFEAAKRLAASLPVNAFVGVVSVGKNPQVLVVPKRGAELPEPDETLLEKDGAQTNIDAAIRLACGLFPAGTTRRLVVISDGQQTRGDAQSAARDASLLDVVISALPLAGERREDVRVARLVSDRQRSHEGATLELTAEIESSLKGEGVVRLFENGVEVETRPIKTEIGKKQTVVFQRTPEERNLYTYRVRVEKFDGDSIHDNNEAMTLVDVRGRPVLLYVEGESDQTRFLVDAMAKEGIRLHVRAPKDFPQSPQDLAGYDGIVVSDTPAHQLTQKSMLLIRDYVEQLGGGFLMIGGKNSFGVGGYYRTPIEEILPVKMKAPDKEERYATSLVLVLDRSGSMRGQKIEICKSAAIATIELLSAKDYVGVVTFDSQARWIVPLTRVKSKGTIRQQVSTINSGGGTNIYPGMSIGRQALTRVKTKVKHMIVLTDGQTRGANYQELAARMRTEGVTISTVGIGSSIQRQLLQQIATAGGGKFYHTVDAANLPRIFTQDAMVHMGRMIREASFNPKHVEKHIMLKGCPIDQAPSLLGYVKTNKKATAQVPLVTDIGDPLLAHWQFGLGKVTAFTSDCKSRWAALWITTWPGYNQFWAQILRETARKPEGQFMDISLKEKSQQAEIVVDVQEDAASFKNEARVQAEVYHVPAGALGASMKPTHAMLLSQSGPGRYEGKFRPDEPGVYLVRARAGSQMVSAGLVHNRSGETATGQVDSDVLNDVAKQTGGSVLAEDAAELPSLERSYTHFVELTPWLLRMFLLVFLVDVAIRRWENVLGMFAFFRGERD